MVSGKSTRGWKTEVRGMSQGGATTTGMRWSWKRRVCNCGECRRCINRRRNVERYRTKFAAGVERPRLPKLPRYEWDRT
jgi:hypothetical protein